MPPPTSVILIISFRLFILERKSLQNIMSLLRSGQTNLTAPSTENQKMQLPSFQRDRLFQENSHQSGLKNGRILPWNTGDYALKCHPAGHQLKIISSSKLDFLTSCIVSAITEKDSSSPSLGSFWGKGFSPDTPPPLSTGPVLRLFQSSAKLVPPGLKYQEIAFYTQLMLTIGPGPFRNHIQLDLCRKRHVLNAGSCSCQRNFENYHFGLVCAMPFTKTFVLKKFCNRGKKEIELKLLAARTERHARVNIHSCTNRMS